MFHDIKIIYHAPHAVFYDRIVFAPINKKGDKDVKIMFDKINSTPQLKAAELYIRVEPRTEVGGEYVQQTILEGGGGEKLQSLHVDGHPTLTPCTTVCRSSYQQKCIQSLGGKTKAMLIMVEMNMKR